MTAVGPTPANAPYDKLKRGNGELARFTATGCTRVMATDPRGSRGGHRVSDGVTNLVQRQPLACPWLVTLCRARRQGAAPLRMILAFVRREVLPAPSLTRTVSLSGRPVRRILRLYLAAKIR